MGEKIILYRYYDLYIIICVFCMYILVAIAIRNFLAKGMGLVHQTFTRLVVYLAVLIFLDLFILFGNDRIFSMNNWVFMLVMSAYYVMLTLCGQCWFIYYYLIIYPNTKWTTTTHLKSSVILFVNVILLFINLWSHRFFYIEDKMYQYGPAIWIEYMLTYGYLAVIFLTMMVVARRPENDFRASYIRRLGFIAVLPVVLGSIQLLFEDTYPLLPIAYTISAMAMYMDSVENLISKDPLTGLNNKGRLLQELNQKMHHRKEGMQVYLFMMDLNKFKSINDTYGHQEGDRALQHFAEALTEAANEMKCHPFLARYGGDEFLMLAEIPSNKDDDYYENQVEQAFLEKEGEHVPLVSALRYDTQANIESGIWQPGRRQLERRMRIFRWLMAGPNHGKYVNMDEYSKQQRQIPEVQLIMGKIQSALHDVNEKYQCPYQIQTSIGVARLNDNVKNVQEFIVMADEDLYQQKKALYGDHGSR